MALLDIVVKNENLLCNLSVTFGNLCEELYYRKEKLPQVKTLKSRIIRCQLTGGKTLPVQPKVGHRIWLEFRNLLQFHGKLER